MPRYLNSQQAAVEETDAQRERYEQQLAERDRKIKVLREHVARQAVKIADQEMQIAELQMILQELTSEQAAANGE